MHWNRREEVMKKRYRGTAVLLAGVMLLAGGSSQNVPESSQAAQETSAEPEITPEQEKVGRSQPSAYNKGMTQRKKRSVHWKTDGSAG